MDFDDEFVRIYESVLMNFDWYIRMDSSSSFYSRVANCFTILFFQS